MTQLGQLLVLRGKTQKGRNRVREHGDLWVVIRPPQRVAFAPGDHVLLRSAKTGSTRWIAIENDFNFMVTQR